MESVEIDFKKAITDLRQVHKLRANEEPAMSEGLAMAEKPRKFTKRTEKAKKIEDYSEEEQAYLQSVLVDLAYNAKVIGGDFSMQVKYGVPFGGSFFDMSQNYIVFDPEHVLDDEAEAKFVAGHEGAHRAISPDPALLGYTQEKLESLYGQIGFAYLQNIIEDPVVNDWLQKRFSAFESLVSYNYDRSFEKDNIPMVTPETQIMTARLGYSPLFTYYGAEIMRYWHTKRLSEGMDPRVEEALKNSLGIANISIQQRPSSKASQAEIIEKARRRFSINADKLYPIMKKLVDEDQLKMAERNALEDYLKTKQELDKKRKQFEEAQKNGDKKSEAELQKEIEDMENELKSKGEFSEEFLKNLEEQIREAMREFKEKMADFNQEKEKLEEQLKKNQSAQGELEKEIDKSSDTGKKAELEKDLSELKEQEKQLKKKLKFADKAASFDNGQSIPIPLDKLSDEMKKELAEFFKNLPPSKQLEFKKRAGDQLKVLEDSLNKSLQGQLQENKDDNSHENQAKRQNAQKEKEDKDKRLEQAAKDAEEERRNQLNNYERAAEDVHDVIEELRNTFIRFFEPNRHPQWRRGFASGQRPNMDYAMQSQIDPRYYSKLWEQKTIPKKMSYSITILLDLSGSMQGENLEESFKAVVALVESLNSFRMIDCEVIAYHNSSYQKVFKKASERLSDDTRDSLGQIMETELGNTTATLHATRYALDRIHQNRKQENILITLTDGSPDSGTESKLSDLVKKAIASSGIKFVGVGLGSGISEENLKKYYPKVLYKPQLKLSEKQLAKGEQTFAADLLDLLKELIINPYDSSFAKQKKEDEYSKASSLLSEENQENNND